VGRVLEREDAALLPGRVEDVLVELFAQRIEELLARGASDGRQDIGRPDEMRLSRGPEPHGLLTVRENGERCGGDENPLSDSRPDAVLEREVDCFIGNAREAG
jgi:hypothetical protein